MLGPYLIKTVNQKVLSLLVKFSDREFYEREVSRRLGISAGGANRASLVPALHPVFGTPNRHGVPNRRVSSRANASFFLFFPSALRLAVGTPTRYGVPGIAVHAFGAVGNSPSWCGIAATAGVCVFSELL